MNSNCLFIGFLTIDHKALGRIRWSKVEILICLCKEELKKKNEIELVEIRFEQEKLFWHVYWQKRNQQRKKKNCNQIKILFTNRSENPMQTVERNSWFWVKAMIWYHSTVWIKLFEKSNHFTSLNFQKQNKWFSRIFVSHYSNKIENYLVFEAYDHFYE
jgi:hypothetical protein